ncbi:unnamed protein product, partial [Larinioides sclopetarius]
MSPEVSVFLRFKKVSYSKNKRIWTFSTNKVKGFSINTL